MKLASMMMAVMFGSASLAAAESEWVLWDHQPPHPVGSVETHPWTARGAAPSYEECEKLRVARLRADAPHHIAVMEELREEVRADSGKDPGEVHVPDEEIERFLQEFIAQPPSDYGYVCLPDTIDPGDG